MAESSREGLGKQEEPDYTSLLKGNEWELPGDAPIGIVVDQAASAFSSRLAEHSWSEEEREDLEIGFREALINAIKYGSAAGGKKIQISLDVRPDELSITVRDEGEGFDWRAAEDPLTQEGVLKTRGRGIFFMKNFYDSVSYNEAGNEITLRIGVEGILGDVPDEWQSKLPKRLKPSDVDVYRDYEDGLWHWHLRSGKIRNDQLREAYESERRSRP